MVTSYNILGEQQYAFFRKTLTPSEKPLHAPIIPFLKYQVMKILSKNVLQTLCNLIVRRVTKEGELFFARNI